MRPRRRAPRADARVGAGLQQVDAPAFEPMVSSRPFAGSHFSCVPQPSSAGCMPSERKPSTDQVLTKTPIGFGFRARWVSRSAMWMPLTPRSRSRSRPALAVAARARRRHGRGRRAMSSSACLTNHDTMPGLAPQQETAVDPPGFFAFSSRTVFAERVVGALLRAQRFCRSRSRATARPRCRCRARRVRGRAA